MPPSESRHFRRCTPVAAPLHDHGVAVIVHGPNLGPAAVPADAVFIRRESWALMGFYFGGLDRARFLQAVEPGDQLLLCACLELTFRTTLRFSTTAFVGTAEVASANMLLTAATGTD